MFSNIYPIVASLVNLFIIHLPGSHYHDSSIREHSGPVAQGTRQGIIQEDQLDWSPITPRFIALLVQPVLSDTACRLEAPSVTMRDQLENRI